MLGSRIFRRLPFKRLARAGPGVDARLSPHLLPTPEELLLDIDDVYAHGTLRDWAVFTHTAAALCAEGDRDTVDAAAVANAYPLAGGGV